MARRMRKCSYRAARFAVLLAFVHVVSAQSQETAKPIAASPIPASKIAALEAELAKKDERASSTQKRMACKGIMREGEALLEAYPAAPNRYRVLGIVFQSQKRLLGLENSERNRSALFHTCGRLAQAPDEYADLRLEADMLLSERDLTAKGATLAERAKALAAIVDRYRGTPAEAKSLMMAALIAPKLQADELERTIHQAMDMRFGGDPEIIEFRRKHLGFSNLYVLFAGTYTRADGVALRFPIDWMGRQGVMVFWSRQTPGFEAYLKLVKEQEDRLPGRFEVLSFNVDELPDAGASTLKALGLNWTVMRLPGGKKSQAYRAYAGEDPVGVFVNAYGRATLEPTMLDPAVQAGLGVRGTATLLLTLPYRLFDARCLAQVRSLLVGDFLVMEPDGPLDPAFPPELAMALTDQDNRASAELSRTADSVPVETLRAIQECFTPEPFCYRLTAAEALAKYEKAEKLCGEAVKQHPDAPDLWIVRNRRIVALMGMWNLACEPKHLESAVREARAIMANKLPRGADVVGRFCLATEAIRRGDAGPEVILSTLIDRTGGAREPVSALAAAAILSLDAGALDLHERYRRALLETPDVDNPRLWSVASFLRDRYHRFLLFKGNDYQPSRQRRGEIRGYIVAHGEPAAIDRLPEVELKDLDGGTLRLPREKSAKLTLLLFVEPPADKAETKLSRGVMSVMQYTAELRDSHVNKELNVIAAFLCDDAKRVDAVMKANSLTCRAAMVPGGLANPMVRRLGIFSADRVANVFLLRRNGTVAWHMSGFYYNDYGFPFAALLAMKVHTEVCDAETGFQALEQGDFRKAVHYFAAPWSPDNDQRYHWAAPRLHGRALAHMGLKEWDAALADVDAAIAAHQKTFDDIKTGPCDVMAEMRLIRATILDQLGRKEEAAAERKAAAVPASAHHTTPYGLFHARLRALRRNQNQEMEKK